MFNHVDENYDCPFCKIVNGIEDDKVYTKQNDIVYQDKVLTAFISSHTLKNNPGNVLIIPNKHIEHIYDMPDDILAKVHKLAKKISIAIRKVYPNCQGNVLRQHNEPVDTKCSGQDVFHYHLHIIPRYENDRMYEYAEDGNRLEMSAENRKFYANLLREELKN